jgi:hypothetical protein
MEQISVILIAIIGAIKFVAMLILVRSLGHWCKHRAFPYRTIARCGQFMFGLVAAHIFFRILCLWWQPVFGGWLLFIDISSTPFAVLMAYFANKAVKDAESGR